MWDTESTAKAYAHGLKERGKHGGIIACALTHRIAYALVRDHATCEPNPLGLNSRRTPERTLDRAFTTSRR